MRLIELTRVNHDWSTEDDKLRYSTDVVLVNPESIAFICKAKLLDGGEEAGGPPNPAASYVQFTGEECYIETLETPSKIRALVTGA